MRQVVRGGIVVGQTSDALQQVVVLVVVGGDRVVAAGFDQDALVIAANVLKLHIF